MAIEDLEKIKGEIPYENLVAPTELSNQDTFPFDCHPGISCFNACCKNIDITILPYDILRLKNREKMSSSQWVNSYTVPFAMDHHQLPGLKLATQEGAKAYIFLGEKGCQVYEDRPTACRYYALGSMGIRREGISYVEDVYFTVQEDHCKGHDESKARRAQREAAKTEQLDKQGQSDFEASSQATLCST